MKNLLLPGAARLFLLPIALCFTLCFSGNAQEPVSPQVKDRLQRLYDSYQKEGGSFEKFVQVNRHVFENPAKRMVTSAVNAKIGISLNTNCGNGDFESGAIDPNEWSGGYGTHGGGQPNPFTLTDGFVSGAINDFNSHQTIVSPGADPIVGIPQVAADGGNYALRIGNAVNNYGTEYVSKTFVVSADKTIFPFRYAVVFQDPNHSPSDQPTFSVRAFDNGGNELPPVCDLGNGSNKVVSDASNSFFQSTTAGGFGLVAYKDWSQAQIDLSPYVGQTITIVFLNKDCGLGGHWGYTYLDNLCVVCTTGCPYNLSLNPNSSTCGVGKICLDYTLPATGNSTGSLVIDLSIYQNGVQVGATQSSPVLTSGTSYCFAIDPATLGLNAGLGGFDFVAKGKFKINNFPLSPVFVGNPPNGQVSGQNNDYLFSSTKAVCKNATVTLSGGTATITAANVDGGSSATCGIASMTVSPATFNCSNIGTNNVVLTVTDVQGNTATCTAVVTVVGQLPSCGVVSIPSDNTYTGGNPNNLYLGYGAQSTTLKVNASGGGPFTYSWSPAAGLSSTSSGAPVFTPAAEGIYTFIVTVKNAFGCTTTCSITICVLDVSVPGSKGKKVYICHTPPGNPGNANTLSVSVNAVSAHIFSPGHGDHLGTCEQVPCGASQRLLPHATAEKLAAMVSEAGLKISALPNPSSGEFVLTVNSAAKEPVMVSIANVYGRMVYSRSNVQPNASFSVGRDFGEGTYYVEVRQGVKTAQLKLMKTR